MSVKILDDVIRIRIDSTQVVQAFAQLLAEQAAAGETLAPANPANRAIYRELAPFRLVEYSYVDTGLADIDGVYVGFPDGSLYSVAEDIPESVVDNLVGGNPETLPPVYVYILLGQPRSAPEIGRFLSALADHLGRPLVGVFRDHDGHMAGRTFGEQAQCLDRQLAGSVLEANRHLDKARVLKRLAERTVASDGRAFAVISYKFSPHLAEFPNTRARDDFIAWSRTLCEWIYARWWTWEDMGLTEILRPAEIASEPRGDSMPVRLVAPMDYEGGAPWRAFGGIGADVVQHPVSDTTISDAVLRSSLVLAQAYWRYVTDTIAAGEALARALADDRRRRGMKPQS
ncbi:MAG: hypothetical protein LDL39_04030 [Magnetospirillum sp.]|nr:hypothetical protein [Magnetospirillum sp.]